MRLIDADALCMHLSDWQFGSMTDGKHEIEYEVINKVIDGIEKEQTVDAVSVVRCKDCKNYVIHVLFGHRQGWCERLCDEFDKSLARGTGDDDFCSRGERRSE